VLLYVINTQWISPSIFSRHSDQSLVRLAAATLRMGDCSSQGNRGGGPSASCTAAAMPKQSDGPSRQHSLPPGWCGTELLILRETLEQRLLRRREWDIGAHPFY